MPCLDTEYKAMLDETFVSTVSEVFLSVCALDLQLIQLEENSLIEPLTDVTSTIAMTSELKSLSISLSMSYDTSAVIISNMIGVSRDEVMAKDLMDGISETLNILAGCAKSMLSMMDGQHYSLSLPMVITGQGHQVIHQKQQQPNGTLTYEFSDGQNPVYLKIVYSNIDNN